MHHFTTIAPFHHCPRSRLVKYPLLLKQVLKYSDDSDDIATITATLGQLERIIGLVDTGMAEARYARKSIFVKKYFKKIPRCAMSVSAMEFMSSVPPACVVEAREEVMSGVLRNSRGTKVSVYLLDSALVVGRQVTRSGVGQVVQVFREPVPVHALAVADLAEGESTKPGSFHRPGSFKGAVFPANASKVNRNAFRLTWVVEEGEEREKGGEEGGGLTLVAMDEHTKRQWVATLAKAIAAAVAARPASPVFDLVDALNNTKPPTPKAKPGSPRRAKLQRKFAAATKLRSTPRLLSASRLLSPLPSTSSTSRLAAISTTPTRAGLFKRNRSPSIKASLSQSALGKVAAGRVSKARLKGLKDQENVPRGAVVAVSGGGKGVAGRRTKSAALMQGMVGRPRNRVPEKRLLQLIDENTRCCVVVMMMMMLMMMVMRLTMSVTMVTPPLRPMSRSMAHLAASPTASPRYLTSTSHPAHPLLTSPSSPSSPSPAQVPHEDPGQAEQVDERPAGHVAPVPSTISCLSSNA